MRIVALLLAMTTGCSWMSSRPVKTYPNGSVDCSTSRGAPGVDTAMAVTLGIGGLAAASESAGAALIPLGLATVYAISAAHGYKQAGQCKEAIEQLAMEADAPSEDRHWVAPRVRSTDASDDEETTDEEPSAPTKAKENVEVEIDASELEPGT